MNCKGEGQLDIPMLWWRARSVSISGSWILCAPDKISSPRMNMSYELLHFCNGKTMVLNVLTTNN